MKLIRCSEKIHYYDSEKFSCCPDCLKKGLISVPEKIVPEDMNADHDGPEFSDYISEKAEKPEKNNILPSDDSDDDVVHTISMTQEESDEHIANIIKNSSSGETNMVFTVSDSTDQFTSSEDDFSGDDETSYEEQECTAAQTEASADPEPASSFASELAASGSTVYISSVPEDDGRTVSFYDTEDTEPVTGWLVCTEGEYRGESFKLKTGQNFIGRAPEMDVYLAKEKTVSRQRHAVIIFEPESCSFYAAPGQSSGLSYLNGQVLLMPAVLKPYDELRLGQASFVFIPFCDPEHNWKKYLG